MTKCKRCNGTGKIKQPMCSGSYCRKYICPYCNGTGEIIQTNDDWRKTCSSEEFAEFISAVLDYGFGIDYAPRNPMGENVNDKEDIIEWLKENHDR